MITRTFIFLDGVSHTREQKIWAQGIRSWDAFLSREKVKGISPKRKTFFNQRIRKAKQALIEQDITFFNSLPKSEMWRLYEQFKDDALFLDIETSGYYGDITVIGMYDRYTTRTMVQGFNMDKQTLKDLFAHYKLLITFNGQSFDVPVMNRFFNTIIPDIPHFDLRFALARLGYHGGLKHIEKERGIRREAEVLEVATGGAVHLWQMWRATGEQKYLDLLVQYNEEDVVNLKPLAEFATKELTSTYFRKCLI